jgi:hemolysin D
LLLHLHGVDVSRDAVAAEKPAQRQGEDRGGEQSAAAGHAGSPGYIAHVALDSTQLVIDGRVETLSPGMTVTAEINTGRRSVISYLLSPLQRYAHEGIRER